MKQLITRVEESLALAVKERAEMTGQSVNSYVTELLRTATSDRAAWKADAMAAGHLISRERSAATVDAKPASTPAGYAAALVSSERDER